SYQHIVPSDACKALLTGRDYIEARVQRYKAVQARVACNGVQRDSGCLVECGNFGAVDDRPRRIGDQAADAAPAGLGKRYRTRAEEKNTNRKKIPRCLDNCSSAIHEQPPNPKSQCDSRMLSPRRPSQKQSNTFIKTYQYCHHVFHSVNRKCTVRGGVESGSPGSVGLDGFLSSLPQRGPNLPSLRH